VRQHRVNSSICLSSAFAFARDSFKEVCQNLPSVSRASNRARRNSRAFASDVAVSTAVHSGGSWLRRSMTISVRRSPALGARQMDGLQRLIATP
jgi:hypothetical protein